MSQVMNLRRVSSPHIADGNSPPNHCQEAPGIVPDEFFSAGSVENQREEPVEEPKYKYNASTKTFARIFQQKDGVISFAKGLDHKWRSLTRTEKDVSKREVDYRVQIKKLTDGIDVFIQEENVGPLDIEIHSKLSIRLEFEQNTQLIKISTIVKKWYGITETFLGVFSTQLLKSHTKVQKQNMEEYGLLTLMGQNIAKSNEKFDKPPQAQESFHFFALGSGHKVKKEDSILGSAHRHFKGLHAESSVKSEIVSGPSDYLGRRFDANVKFGVKKVLDYIFEHKDDAVINIKLLGHSRGASETIAIYNIVNLILHKHTHVEDTNAMLKLLGIEDVRDFIGVVGSIHYSFFLLDPVRGSIDMHMQTFFLTRYLAAPRANDEICVELVQSIANKGIQNTTNFDISHIKIDSPDQTYVRVHSIDANHGHIDKFPSIERGNNEASFELLNHFLKIELERPRSLKEAKKPLHLHEAAHVADTSNPTSKRRRMKEESFTILKTDFNLTDEQVTVLLRQNNHLLRALNKGEITRDAVRNLSYDHLELIFGGSSGSEMVREAIKFGRVTYNDIYSISNENIRMFKKCMYENMYATDYLLPQERLTAIFILYPDLFNAKNEGKISDDEILSLTARQIERNLGSISNNNEPVFFHIGEIRALMGRDGYILNDYEIQNPGYKNKLFALLLLNRAFFQAYKQRHITIQQILLFTPEKLEILFKENSSFPKALKDKVIKQGHLEGISQYNHEQLESFFVRHSYFTDQLRQT